jgi:hypothetical protein
LKIGLQEISRSFNGCSSFYAIEKIININPPLTTNIAKKYLGLRKNHGAINPSHQSNQTKHI